MDIRHLLASDAPLTPGNAVAALIVRPDGALLMQLRDDRDDIFYPGHWGLFGGAVEPGEDDETALRRELEEELGLRVDEAEPFVRFDFDLRTMGGQKLYRQFFVVKPDESSFAELTLGEGKAMAAMAVAEVLGGPPLVPYDAFAIWLHASRGRLAVTAPIDSGRNPRVR